MWTNERVVGTAWPLIVAHDDADLIALYRPVGSIGRQRTGDFGGPRGRILVRWDGGYRELLWHSVNVLVVHRPGDMYSVWRAWSDPAWALAWRYINIEEPWRRTPIGFDSKDLYLDLACSPDGSEWRWKDEDEFAWGIENGRITRERATAARVAGENAVARIRAGEPPHDRDWDSWRPDPAWTIPRLHKMWREYDPDDLARIALARDVRDDPPREVREQPLHKERPAISGADEL